MELIGQENILGGVDPGDKDLIAEVDYAGSDDVDWLAGDPFIHLPAPHEQLIVNGASAAALRIRLRAVTEIHGKRVEDLTALKTQAETLQTAFTRKIEERARADSSENPFQTGAAWNI